MDTLTFAMGPVQLDEDGDALRERFASRLGAALDRPLEVRAARSYADVAAMLAEGTAEIAWLSPAVYARLGSKASLVAAVDRGRGEGYRGVLFVPADSKVRAPAELAGARVAWVDRDSCAGHLFPRLALRAAGLDPDALFAEQRFLGGHGSVVHAVLRGEADAGATFAHAAPDGTLKLAAWYPYAGAAAMRAVLISAPIPADVIAAAPSLDMQALRRAFLSLHEEDDELLEDLFGGSRFVAASGEDYDPVRAALE